MNETTKTIQIFLPGGLPSRLASHNQQKDFWQRALILVSRTDSLSKRSRH